MRRGADVNNIMATRKIMTKLILIMSVWGNIKPVALK